ncbi:MAG: DegV family protein, partial [Oscillospiraceae bacterium]|nr:DegV family protein [Oscillospiraceae bacterium]
YIENHPEATVRQLEEYAAKLVDRARFVFFPGDLEYLKAGGRVSNAAYLLASFLGLKPLIEILDGKLVGTKKYRGSDSKIYRKLINDYLSANSLEKDSFFMVYSEGIDPQLKTELETEAVKLGYSNVTWVPTGCVISTHSGPGAFGLGGFVI